ncbi:Sperm flagellar protein 1 [Nibea albiflora]|uniref:Sperm flagellar protein 1 n=1 Tax=Nibea albiflora TaxID=240163 RepID=A0ACB7EE23_NIBAL|nr:Sperm flagellar protein 1 [Nibea albiflora]
MDRELNEEELQDLYAWIDKIPLSRPKRHITRDFSDGEFNQTEVKVLAQLPEEAKKDEKSRPKKGKPQNTVQFYTDMDPKLRQILREKEQAVMDLQETVEILQMKVTRLEHLVQLKDMRIEDLNRHLETYKGKGIKG